MLRRLWTADKIHELPEMQVHEGYCRSDPHEELVQTDGELNRLAALRLERDDDIFSHQLETGFRNLDDLRWNFGLCRVESLLDFGNLYGGDRALRIDGLH